MAHKETIHTRTVNPSKKGVNIDKDKYMLISRAILDILSNTDEVVFRDLPGRVRKQLKEPFEGSISWYTTTIKLDMERRGVIERIPGSKPQRLRLSKK